MSAPIGKGGIGGPPTATAPAETADTQKGIPTDTVAAAEQRAAIGQTPPPEATFDAVSDGSMDSTPAGASTLAQQLESRAGTTSPDAATGSAPPPSASDELAAQEQQLGAAPRDVTKGR